jgi:UDP-glucose 4-epimerase
MAAVRQAAVRQKRERPMTILLTGGAGFIGSHTCVELLDAGYDVVIIDNLSNSSPKAVSAIRDITGREPAFYPYDLLDADACRAVFTAHKIDSVIHFAGLKAVGESVEKPLLYYQNNITGTLNLLQLMREYGVCSIVFSSSATVYGSPQSVPIKEDAPLSAANPYGATKLFIERILADAAAADPGLSVVSLRYFNPIGAHPSGRLGENPRGIPNNLLPYIAQVAVGRLEKLRVFGNDYPTPDGTGVRDYIHVTDLGRGHISALERDADRPGVHIYNLGTGQGYSVLEIIDAFIQATGMEIPYEIVGRRAGDVAVCYADPAKANTQLNWYAARGLRQMCEDAWRWQQSHPNGFED